MGGKWNKWVHAKQTGCYLAANPSTAVAVHQPAYSVWFWNASLTKNVTNMQKAVLTKVI